MPYIKPREVPFVNVQRLIRGYGHHGGTLADILGVSPPTARKRLENPELLTLADLAKISRRAHIPWDDIKEAMKL